MSQNSVSGIWWGFNIQIKLHLRGIIPRMEMKNLHKGICEKMILFAFSYNEVGEAGISSVLCKLLKDSGPFHERVMRPFTRT